MCGTERQVIGHGRNTVGVGIFGGAEPGVGSANPGLKYGTPIGVLECYRFGFCR